MLMLAAWHITLLSILFVGICLFMILVILIQKPRGGGLSGGYGGEGWPRVVQRVELDRIQEQLGKPLLPFVLRLSPASDHGYGRDWQIRTGLTPERHVGYAVQWFALAAALAGLCGWVAVKRAPEEPHGP